MDKMTLDPYLQKQVELGMDGADIMHGHLKTLMVEAEQELQSAVDAEEETGEAMDSMARTYAEGVCDTLAQVYELTYAIAFAKSEKAEVNG